MKTNLFSIILMMNFSLIISSCSLSNGQHGKGNIFESEWGLVSVKAKSIDSLLIAHQGNTATLHVLQDGTVKGKTGCNSFEGQVAIDGYSLKFGNLICTQLTCADSTLTTAFYTMLDSTDNYTVDHGHLLLRKGDKVLAKLMPLNMR
jgi:heat shock protein HslJ